MKINVLVTSVGGDIGANIVSILDEQNLFEVNMIGVDIKTHVFAEKELNHFYCIPKLLDDGYFPALSRIIKAHNIDIIIPSSEMDILYLHKNMEKFLFLDVKLLINSSKIVNIFLDKYQTSTELNDLNISTPATYILGSYKNEETFPLIIKASRSTTSKMITKINDEKMLAETKKNISSPDKYIVQEYIGTEDEEYTTAVYRNNTTIKVITFQRRLDGDKTGYAKIVNSEILTQYAIRIAEKYNLKGSINIQSRKLKNDYYIFEINPRISSTVYIRNYFGFHDLLWWITDILNISIDIEYNEQFKNGVAIIGYKYRFYNEES